VQSNRDFAVLLVHIGYNGKNKPRKDSMKHLSSIFMLLFITLVMPIQMQEGVEPSVILGGHGFVVDMAWSPDGEILAVSVQSGIILYDKDLQQIDILKPTTKFNAGGRIAWSPDGTKLAMGSILVPPYGNEASKHGDEAYIWDIETRQIQYTLELEEGESVLFVLWNSSGDVVFAPIETNLQELKRLVFWDATNCETHSHDVSQDQISRVLEWSWADDDRSITGERFEDNIVFDVETGTIIERIPTDGPDNSKHIFSPDGSSWAYWLDGVIFVESEDGEAFEIRGDDASSFKGMKKFEWSADGSMVVAWGNRMTPNLIIADAETGEYLLELMYEEDGAIVEAHFNAQGDRFLVSTASRLLMYDVPSWEIIDERWLFAPSRAVSFSPDGTRIATTSGGGLAVYIWAAQTGEEITRLIPERDPTKRYGYIHSMVWSPDGRYIATGGQLSVIVTRQKESQPIDMFIWDVGTGEIFQTVPALAYEVDFINRIEWSAESSHVAYSTVSNQYGTSHIGVWDVVSSNMLFLTPLETSVWDIALHPDGEVLVALTMDDEFEDIASVFDVTSGVLLSGERLTTSAESINSIDWHPDGKYLAAVVRNEDDTDEIRIWEMLQDYSLELVMSFEVIGQPSGSQLEWNAAGDSLAFTYLDIERDVSAVQIWDVSIDDGTATLWNTYFPTLPEGMPSRFTLSGIAWSHDGTRIAAGLTWSSTQIWER
jgi:WD40 repeat protein